MKFLSRGLNNFRKFLGLSEDVRTRVKTTFFENRLWWDGTILCWLTVPPTKIRTHSSAVQPVSCSPQSGGRGHRTRIPISDLDLGQIGCGVLKIFCFQMTLMIVNLIGLLEDEDLLVSSPGAPRHDKSYDGK